MPRWVDVFFTSAKKRYYWLRIWNATRNKHKIRSLFFLRSWLGTDRFYSYLQGYLITGDEAFHFGDIITSSMVPQITGVLMVCSAVGSGAEQRKHQSSTSLAIMRRFHRWPMNYPHKGPVTPKIIPFDDVINYCIAPMKLLWGIWINRY